MQDFITHNPAALQFLMTDDVYLIPDRNFTSEALQIYPLPEKTTESIEYEDIAPKDFIYLGENNKYFLILVDDKTHKDLNAEDQEMLLKIMEAKGLTLHDIAILNLDRYPNTFFTDLKEFFACNRLVSFGVSPQKIGISSITLNQSEKHMDVKILATYSLEQMKNDLEKKRKFWTVMKLF